MSRFSEEADRLVRLGYYVFQCEPKMKIPFATKPDGTAPNGCNSASDNPDVVRDWWERHPDCNIGLKCENVLIIDVDNKNGKKGNGDFARIIERVGPVP
ncbi:MAG: bifunctional DNA primase/polymerase, partial [Planctomycetaceae bacterium]|nr:bifunctional DNA primase/polymerase [Planctomycetaceae bacterium]